MPPKRRRVSMDRVRNKKTELDNRSSTDFHELKDGWNYFYVLPPWSDDVEEIWKEVQQHGLLVCPRSVSDTTECLLCSEIRKRLRKGDSDFADKHRLRTRAFFNAIRKDKIREKDQYNVKVLAVSSKTFEEIIDHMADEDIDISNPEAAVPVAINKKGKGLRTRYKVRFGEPTDISKYLTDEVWEALHDLDTMRSSQPATVQDMRKAIRGAADEDDDGDFDDEELEGTEELAEEDEVFEDPGDEDYPEMDEDVYEDEDLDSLDAELEALEEEDEPERKPAPRAARKAAKKAAKPAARPAKPVKRPTAAVPRKAAKKAARRPVRR